MVHTGLKIVWHTCSSVRKCPGRATEVFHFQPSGKAEWATKEEALKAEIREKEEKWCELPPRHDLRRTRASSWVRTCFHAPEKRQDEYIRRNGFKGAPRMRRSLPHGRLLYLCPGRTKCTWPLGKSDAGSTVSFKMVSLIRFGRSTVEGGCYCRGSQENVS